MTDRLEADEQPESSDSHVAAANFEWHTLSACTDEVACPIHGREARCCVCGGGPVVYRNYAEQPFCRHCADCPCTQVPCVHVGVNDPDVSSEARIASLEAELVQARGVIDRVRALHQPMPNTMAGTICAGCHVGDPFETHDWPCPTARAIDQPTGL